MRATYHQDGSTSLRLSPDELHTLAACAEFGALHWENIVDRGHSLTGRRADRIDRAVAADHRHLRDDLRAAVAGERSAA